MERMMDDEQSAPRRPDSRANSGANGVTFLALGGLSLLAFGFLAFLGVLTSGILFFGVLAVLLGLGGLVAFHYLTWGWWLSKMRDDE